MPALAALLVAACELLGPGAPVEFSIDTWPKPSHESIEAARKLRSDIAEGRHARKPDFKRAPIGYKQHLEHMRHCTSCWQRDYRDSLLRKAFNPLLGAAQLLIDDYTMHQHRCAVRVAEPPQKTLLDMRCPGTCDTNGSQYARNRAAWNMFGMYGSVIKLQGKLHMWLGEYQAYHADSIDGITWSPLRRIKRLRPLNVCVTHDRTHEELIMGYHCGNLGSTESACIATSTNGENWTPAGSPSDHPLRNTDSCASINACCAKPCEAHADSSNCVRFDEAHGQYVLTKRQAFATSRKPEGWREIRGVGFAIASRQDFVGGRAYKQTGSSSLRPRFSPHSEWYLDREGKEERFRRQIYTLSVAELQADGGDSDGQNEHQQRRTSRSLPGVAPAGAQRIGLYIGVMAVLEWPSVNSTLSIDRNLPPYVHDTVSAYLLPSRDGLHFDLSSIYAEQPAIQHGGCKPGARDARTDCAYDHGYIQPASELLTHAGQHWLYYEARPLPHIHRWKVPARIAVARWPLNRLAALRADPRCAATPQPCAELVTKTFKLRARVLTLNVRVGASIGSSVHVEVVQGLRSLHEPFDGFGHADAVTIKNEDTAAAQALWKGARLQQLYGMRVRLRFSLCGDAALFAWTLSS